MDQADHRGSARTRAPKLDRTARRDQLARFALDVVGSQGIQALSIAAVAERAGLVASGVYKHFRDKDELIDTALGLIGDRLMANVDAVCRESDDALDCLRRLLARHADLIRSGLGIPRISFSDDVFVGHPQRKARVYGFVKRYLDAVAEIVRRGQAAGRIRGDIDPATASVLFLGLVQPAGVLWHLSAGVFDVELHLARAWEVFASALACKPEKRPVGRAKGDTR